MEEIELTPGRLQKALAWIVRKAGLRNLAVWTLLSLALLSLVFGLAEAVRGLDANLLFPITALAALSGWVLARWQRGWLAAVCLLSIGVVVVVVRVGNLTRQALDFLVALNGQVVAYQRPQPGVLLPDGAHLIAALSALAAGAETLLGRGLAWLQSVRQGSPAYDLAATALLWSMAVWAASAWAAWELRRDARPLPALAPTGMLLSFTLAFVRASSAYLVLFLAAWLFLSAFLSYQRELLRWEVTGVDYSEDVRLDIAMVTILAVIAITTIAWASPAVNLHRLLEFTRRPPPAASEQSKKVGRSLGLETRPQPRSLAVLEELRSGGLPRAHLLGSGPELSKDLVMVVQTGEIPPGPPDQVLRNPAPRHYWRSLTYDRYSGRGWIASSTQVVAYRSGEATIAWPSGPEPAASQPAQSARLVNQQVRRVGDDPGSLLYTAGWLLSAGSDFTAAWRRLPPSGPQPGATAYNALVLQSDLFGATIQPREYQAASVENRPDTAVLRAARGSYPDWIATRYLSLPDSVPARVLGLARDLTAAEPTPFDRALAIESYLRTFEYTLDLPAPPTDRDVVDYFLFDLKKGYCDYYASAMVVLARAAGLPARLVTGYASGSYDSYHAEYRVTAADAHSWSEIYFSGVGWVEFEPTAARPEIDYREAAIESLLPAAPADGSKPGTAWTGQLRSALTAALAALGLAGFALLAYWGLGEWRLSRLPPALAIAAVFRRFRQLGQQLNLPLHPGDTPFEVASAFERRYPYDQRGGKTRLRIPVRPIVRPAEAPDRSNASPPDRAAEAGWQLARLYSAATFSPRQPEDQDRQQAVRLWRGLRWLVRWERLLRRFRRF